MGAKKIYAVVAALWLTFPTWAQPTRNEIFLPDIPGYVTLKCDFHMHTVFSDGNVWPVNRVEEAWREGLDAISITDHLEYTPHRDHIPVNHEASFDIASGAALKKGIILIKGTEITKQMPPGHFNALFIDSATEIYNDDYKLSLREAKRQGAFVIWNHPGWTAQTPEGPVWMKEHEELYSEQLFDGVEVANYNEWYPEVLDWADQKKLTIFSNSDIHEPMSDFLEDHKLKRRPITLVFAKEATPEGIREALNSRRTAGWFLQYLLAPLPLLEKLAIASITVSMVSRNDNTVNYKAMNSSDFVFDMKYSTSGNNTLNLPERSSVLLSFPVGEANPEITFANLLSGKSQPLTLEISRLIKQSDACK